MGIPPFRLPQRAVEEDIGYIEAMGVEIKTNSPVGKGNSLKSLMSDSEALIIAVGAQRPLKLGVEGEDSLLAMWNTSLAFDFAICSSTQLHM